jgi:hypothetical protein
MKLVFLQKTKLACDFGGGVNVMLQIFFAGQRPTS